MCGVVRLNGKWCGQECKMCVVVRLTGKWYGQE